MSSNGKATSSIKTKNAKTMKKTTKKTIKLDKESVVTYYKNIIDDKEAKNIYDYLKRYIKWEQGTYMMFGKPIKTPRLLYAVRDKDTDITDVYNVTNSREWPKQLLSLKKKVEKITGKKFRYAQLNYYRNGKDHIGYHTDSEVKKGDIIASISLGAERRFLMRHKNYKTNDKETVRLTLENGSLLVMDENAAKNNWKHSIPQSKTVTNGRINITFRPN